MTEWVEEGPHREAESVDARAAPLRVEGVAVAPADMSPMRALSLAAVARGYKPRERTLVRGGDGTLHFHLARPDPHEVAHFGAVGATDATLRRERARSAARALHAQATAAAPDGSGYYGISAGRAVVTAVENAAARMHSSGLGDGLDEGEEGCLLCEPARLAEFVFGSDGAHALRRMQIGPATAPAGLLGRTMLRMFHLLPVRSLRTTDPVALAAVFAAPLGLVQGELASALRTRGPAALHQACREGGVLLTVAAAIAILRPIGDVAPDRLTSMASFRRSRRSLRAADGPVEDDAALALATSSRVSIDRSTPIDVAARASAAAEGGGGRSGAGFTKTDCAVLAAILGARLLDGWNVQRALERVPDSPGTVVHTVLRMWKDTWTAAGLGWGEVRLEALVDDCAFPAAMVRMAEVRNACRLFLPMAQRAVELRETKWCLTMDDAAPIARAVLERWEARSPTLRSGTWRSLVLASSTRRHGHSLALALTSSPASWEQDVASAVVSDAKALVAEASAGYSIPETLSEVSEVQRHYEVLLAVEQDLRWHRASPVATSAPPPPPPPPSAAPAALPAEPHQPQGGKILRGWSSPWSKGRDEKREVKERGMEEVFPPAPPVDLRLFPWRATHRAANGLAPIVHTNPLNVTSPSQPHASPPSHASSSLHQDLAIANGLVPLGTLRAFPPAGARTVLFAAGSPVAASHSTLNPMLLLPTVDVPSVLPSRPAPPSPVAVSAAPPSESFVAARTATTPDAPETDDDDDDELHESLHDVIVAKARRIAAARAAIAASSAARTSVPLH